MADTRKKAIIEVTLEDKASAGLKKMQSTTDKAGIDMKAAFSKIALAVAGVTAAVAGATAAIMAMGTRAGKFDALAMGFERNFGNMRESLDRLGKAAAGTVSDFDLMQTANRAALLGVTTDVDKLAGLMVTARLRGREMGMDMTQSFDDIVRGIGRMSPLILDNLGIIIPDAIKKSMESMTEMEQRQVLLNYAIEDGARLAKEYGEVGLTTAEKVEALKSKVVNLKDEALVALSEPLGRIIDKFVEWIEKIEKAAKAMGDAASDEMAGMIAVLGDDTTGLKASIDRVGIAWGELVEGMGGKNKNALELMIEMFTGWGLILSKVADGLSAIFFWFDKVIKKAKEWDKANTTKFIENHPGGGNTWDTFGRATGGVTSGGLTMVGERGAELVSLPRGSHVYNSEDTKQMVGGGGITINVNAPVTGGDNKKAPILEAETEATARQNRLANYNLL
jgi:hypothetical protein